MKYVITLLTVFLFQVTRLEAQSFWPKILKTNQPIPAVIIDDDTIPNITLPTLTVFPWRKLGNDRFSRDYIILAQKVRKVYPYARLAIRVLNKINDTIAKMDKSNARKRYIKEYEKALLAEYKTELVRMTVSEGRILVKLIDRETGRTSYTLVEQMRGTFSAIFWQSLARLFGETLKVNYDPKGKDYLIEEIVTKIENGQLEPIPLPTKK